MIVCALGVIKNGERPLALVVSHGRFTLAGLQHYFGVLDLRAW